MCLPCVNKKFIKQLYKKKKKKSPFILNYVMTWSLFGYVGSLVSFTEFSHILKNYHPLLNFVLTWSPFGYVGSLVSFLEFSHIPKNHHPLLNYVLTWSPNGYVGSLVLFTKFNHMSKKKNHFPPNKWSILCTQENLHKYKSMPKTKTKNIKTKDAKAKSICQLGLQIQ